MAKRPQHAVCTQCGAGVLAVPKLSFMGLPRFACQACGVTFSAPLSGARRKTMTVIAVIFGVATVGALAAGLVLLPGILPVAAVVALVQDSTARKKLQEVEQRRVPIG